MITDSQMWWLAPFLFYIIVIWIIEGWTADWMPTSAMGNCDDLFFTIFKMMNRLIKKIIVWLISKKKKSFVEALFYTVCHFKWTFSLSSVVSNCISKGEVFKNGKMTMLCPFCDTGCCHKPKTFTSPLKTNLSSDFMCISFKLMQFVWIWILEK